jgi:hypothetical protein
MIEAGRIGLNDAEAAAIEKLQGENPDAPISLTRSEPGETGPLLVHVGEDSYQIAEDGKRKKLT